MNIAPKDIDALQWRHNEHDGVSNHQLHVFLLSRLCRRKSKKTSKRYVTGRCQGNSPVTDEFLTERTSNAEHVSILMTSSPYLKMYFSHSITHTRFSNFRYNTHCLFPFYNLRYWKFCRNTSTRLDLNHVCNTIIVRHYENLKIDTWYQGSI